MHKSQTQQSLVWWVQADADRAWYEGEAGRRQAAQAAAEAEKHQQQAERKQTYQDLQAAAALRQKEAQLLEHRQAPLLHQSFCLDQGTRHRLVFPACGDASQQPDEREAGHVLRVSEEWGVTL